MVDKGLPASPGAAVGRIVLRADDAEAWHSQGKSVIFFFFFLRNRKECHLDLLKVIPFFIILFLSENG